MSNRNLGYAYAATLALLSMPLHEPSVSFMDTYSFTNSCNVIEEIDLWESTSESMQLSQKSLNEDWENENDERWGSLPNV